MAMPDSEAKREWMRENSVNFTVKFMKKADKDILCFFDEMNERGVKRGSIVKAALREYMENHKEEK